MIMMVPLVVVVAALVCCQSQVEEATGASENGRLITRFALIGGISIGRERERERVCCA